MRSVRLLVIFVVVISTMKATAFPNVWSSYFMEEAPNNQVPEGFKRKVTLSVEDMTWEPRYKRSISDAENGSMESLSTTTEAEIPTTKSHLQIRIVEPPAYSGIPIGMPDGSEVVWTQVGSFLENLYHKIAG